MSSLLCCMCGKPEIQKTACGRFIEPKSGPRGGKDVTGRLCGICAQWMLRQKIAFIPWDGGLREIVQKAKEPGAELGDVALRRRKKK